MRTVGFAISNDRGVSRYRYMNPQLHRSGVIETAVTVARDHQTGKTAKTGLYWARLSARIESTS